MLDAGIRWGNEILGERGKSRGEAREEAVGMLEKK